MQHALLPSLGRNNERRQYAVCRYYARFWQCPRFLYDYLTTCALRLWDAKIEPAVQWQSDLNSDDFCTYCWPTWCRIPNLFFSIHTITVPFECVFVNKSLHTLEIATETQQHAYEFRSILLSLLLCPQRRQHPVISIPCTILTIQKAPCTITW